MRVNDNGKELQEALDTIDMEAWLDQEGVEYKVTRGSRGTQLNIKECPCCGGSSWKVYLNADTGLGNCFSGDCETKFNKWKFIRATMGRASTGEVIQHIKDVAKEQGWRPPKRTTMAVNTDRADLKLPKSYPMPHEGRNLKYLENRNITGDIAAYFNLRYSPNGKFFYEGEGGKTYVQDYSKRIIIPVFDLEGELVSFQGRDITGTAEKKYLFPPGYASTGSILYNGQNAIGAERVAIGEGVFDVAATKIALDGDMALRDVVPIGTFGKHLSFGDENSQLSKLLFLKEKGLREVTFLWDGEKKAIQAAIQTAMMLHGYGFHARVAILPKDKDPNEITGEELRRCFWNATTINATSAAKLALLANSR